MANLKKCILCRIEKEVSEFYHDSSRKDGYSNKCRKCFKEHYLLKEKHGSYHATSTNGYHTKYGTKIDMIIPDLSTPVVTVDLWRCQCCGALQPPSLHPYRFEFPIDEFINVCAACKNEECIKLFKRLVSSPC